MGDEMEILLGYGRPMRRVTDAAKRAQSVVRRHPLAVDTVIAGVLALAGLVSLDATYAELPPNDPAFSHGFTVVVVASMLAITLPLALRRRFPFSVGVVVVTGFLVARVVVHVPEANITLLSLWLMFYSVAVYGDRRFRTPFLALCYLAIVAELTHELFFPGPSGATQFGRSFDLLYNVVVLSLPWMLGAAIWALRDRQRTLTVQTADLQREREENERQAVFAERVRIARELHDVVAHHVSVMGVQAAGTRRVMDRDPQRAAEALSSIEHSSRRAVAELHRLLGFLRRAGDADELAPQPSLAQLGDLIDESREADLNVCVTIRGEARPLSPTLEVSAYRIIQEALTNVRKHSQASTAQVGLLYRPTELEVEILDDGPGSEADEAGSETGHGLIGIRERAALHGGHLCADPRPGGGFAVHAVFPLTGDAA